MSKILPFLLVAVAGACGAPAYRPPNVQLAPAYDAVARASAAPASRDSVTVSPRAGTGVVAVSNGDVAGRLDAPSAQYSASIAA